LGGGCTGAVAVTIFGTADRAGFIDDPVAIVVRVVALVDLAGVDLFACWIFGVIFAVFLAAVVTAVIVLTILTGVALTEIATGAPAIAILVDAIRGGIFIADLRPFLILLTHLIGADAVVIGLALEDPGARGSLLEGDRAGRQEAEEGNETGE